MNKSYDPRVNRMKVESATAPEKTESNYLESFEVFHQKKSGAAFKHVGGVQGSDHEMALVLAKEQFGRRGVTNNLWVVKTSDVFGFSSGMEGIFDNIESKTYREATDYKVRDTIEAFKEKNEKS